MSSRRSDSEHLELWWGPLVLILIAAAIVLFVLNVSG